MVVSCIVTLLIAVLCCCSGGSGSSAGSGSGVAPAPTPAPCGGGGLSAEEVKLYEELCTKLEECGKTDFAKAVRHNIVNNERIDDSMKSIYLAAIATATAPAPATNPAPAPAGEW